MASITLKDIPDLRHLLRAKDRHDRFARKLGDEIGAPPRRHATRRAPR